MRTPTLLFLSFLSSGISAQSTVDFNNYQLLSCHGTIPADFLTASKDKYAADVQRETTNSGGKPDQDVLNFYLETEFTIDDMLFSGKVLFGDPATNYVNKVADVVLADQPDLRSKLRFYCLRSYEVNAFSTQEGIVFVSLGLLAKVNNEAELAFVLSHEIAHYEKDHNLIEYLNKLKVSNTSGNNNSSDQTIRLESEYSKELELEADSLGILRLAKTPFACSQSISLMDVLNNAERPYIDGNFNFALLETSLMKFPSKYVVDSLEHISVEKNDNTDDLSTHPNTELRKKTLKRIIDRENTKGSQSFISTDSLEFLQLRKMCRFECVHCMLLNGKYCDAAFSVSALLPADPNSIYLKRSMGMALYGIAKYKSQNLFYGFMQKIYYQSASQQKFYFTLKTLSNDAMSMIAFRYLYNLSFIDDAVSTHSMLYDIAFDNVFHDAIGSGRIKDYYANYQYDMAHKNDTSSNLKSDSATVSVKHDDDPHHQNFNSTPKPKSKDAKNGGGGEKGDGSNALRAKEEQFYLLAFADVVDSTLFRTLLDSAHSRQIRQDYNNYHRDNGLDIPALGIDTLLISQPVYKSSDDKHSILYVRSETQQLLLTDQLRQNAGKVKLAAEIFDVHELHAGDVDRFNDMAVINDWGIEVFSHKNDLGFIPIETDRMLAVAHKYNATHVSFTGVYDTNKKKNNRALLGRTTYYTFIYNVLTGMYQLNKVYTYKKAPSKSDLNADMITLMRKIQVG